MSYRSPSGDEGQALPTDVRSQLKLLNEIRGVRVLIVGDIMLDHDRIGRATRISPEAPVPVLLNPRSEYRLGGAAGVAAMCAALGADVQLLGVIGDDASGQRVAELLDAARVAFVGEVVPERIVTTTKERICGVAGGRHRQQLSRLDYETPGPLPRDVVLALRKDLIELMASHPDALLVSDYAKGVMAYEVATVDNPYCPVMIVDPPRGGDWSKYECYDCIVPNRDEAAGRTASQLKEAFATEAAIVKLDHEGCQVDWSGKKGPAVKLSANARAVHDVTGAGDQFLAVLGCVRAIGGEWLQAAELANIAAGLQVERHGCVPVTLEELVREVAGDTRIAKVA